MHQISPAWTQPPAWTTLMPNPGPLGRLIARRRAELGLTQGELSKLTEQHGPGINQNNISRLESGKTQRINDPERLRSLGKALGLESDVEFVLAAYAPDIVRGAMPTAADIEMSLGVDGELIALVKRIPRQNRQQAIKILRVLTDDEPPEPGS